MVRVAWVTPFAPDRAGGGGQIRQAHLLLGLAEQADVELICPGPLTDPQVRSALYALHELPPVAADWRQRHRLLRRGSDLVAALATHRPIELRSFRAYRRAMAPTVRLLNSDSDLDVVLVEYAGLAPLLPAEGDHGGARWVLTLHNLPSRMSAQQAELASGRRQRWLLERDAAAASAFERGAAAAFDSVIACTAEDAAAVAPETDAVIVPNGVDVEQFSPSPLPGAPRVVFTGALYTTPNVDAVAWFCRDVLPRLRVVKPEVEFVIVGARPVDAVRELAASPGVTVVADVASVEPHLAAARLAVVPVRIGSGTRLKALEAMAAGRPVVGTTVGLEGLGLQPGEHVLLADGADAFAAAVLRLLDDDRLAAALAAAGRSEVERRFAWPAIAANFRTDVLAMAAGRR